MEKTILKIH